MYNDDRLRAPNADFGLLSPYIVDTGKRVLRQTVKTQMKCHLKWCSSGSALFAKIQSSEIETHDYRNFDWQPLKIQKWAIYRSTCMGKIHKEVF